MTYDKPEIRDFGNIAEHTYGSGDFIGLSGQQGGDDGGDNLTL